MEIVSRETLRGAKVAPFFNILKFKIMLKITLTTESYELKEGRKTVFELKETETKTIDLETHKMIVDASPFFKRLGGSEVIERSYTCTGYVVTKITSKSPDRDVKTVRKFKFDYVN